MSFNEFLEQSIDKFYTEVLTESGDISKRIAEILGLKDMNAEEAAKKIVDFIMNSKEADLEKVDQGIETIKKLGMVAEGAELDEASILDFITKMDAKLKTIILAALVIAPNLMANPITDLKVASDEAILKMAPQAMLNYLKDKKEQLEQEAGANITDVRKKLEDIVKDKIKGVNKDAGEAIKDKAQEIGKDAIEKGGNFMHKMKDELDKSRHAPEIKPDVKPESNIDRTNPSNI